MSLLIDLVLERSDFKINFCFKWSYRKMSPCQYTDPFLTINECGAVFVGVCLGFGVDSEKKTAY